MIIALFGFSSLVYGQKQTNIWYFGADGTGLDFNPCTPVVLDDGWTDPVIGSYLFEGSTAISDTSGKLLFYSNGASVIGNNHLPMVNGQNIGHSSTLTQNIIVPKPGSETIYYLFIPEIQAFIHYGGSSLIYATIDMSENGGAGKVINRKTELLSHQNTMVTEKLTAVPHSNGRDYWVISHEFGSRKFYTFLVDSNGPDPNPVISDVGPRITSSVANNYDCLGEIKASPNGRKLSLTTWDSPIRALFDFDASTGILSNWISLPAKYGGYGTSFSPNNSKLYFSEGGFNSPYHIGRLVQFDLSDTDSNAIKNSYTELWFDSVLGPLKETPYSLKIGPDGKIYTGKKAESYYLGVVEYPNLPGAQASYVRDGLYLEGYEATWGLNNAIEYNWNCGIPQAVNETRRKEFIRVYPNPTSNGIWIDMDGEKGKKTHVSLLDTRGKSLVETTRSNSKFYMDIKPFEKGVYYLKIESGTKLKTFRILRN